MTAAAYHTVADYFRSNPSDPWHFSSLISIFLSLSIVLVIVCLLSVFKFPCQRVGVLWLSSIVRAGQCILNFEFSLKIFNFFFLILAKEKKKLGKKNNIDAIMAICAVHVSCLCLSMSVIMSPLYLKWHACTRDPDNVHSELHVRILSLALQNTREFLRKASKFEAKVV